MDIDLQSRDVQSSSTIVPIGTSTNLLYGYNPSWLTEETGNNALFPTPIAPVQPSPPSVPSSLGTWSFPTVTLHDTPESLLDVLLPYQQHDPEDGLHAATLPCGPLLIGDEDREKALATLSETLGVDLGADDTGFALVRLERVDGEATHASNQMGLLVHPNPARIPDEYGVTSEFTREMADLKRVRDRETFTPDDITADDANSYLRLFQQQGTHYVSKVTVGDVLFQVFAMPKARFERVKSMYASQPGALSGPDAVLFRQYTTDANTGMFGYVKEYGTLLSFSRSRALASDVEAGKWRETTFAETTSLFALYQHNASVTPETLNETYTDVTSVAVELTSLALFAEHSRRLIWNRVFKGAVVQKYRRAVQPTFRTYCQCDIGDRFQNDIPGFLSTIATPTINTYKAGLDLASLDFVAPKEVKTFTLYANYLYSTTAAVVNVPGPDALVCLQLASLERAPKVPLLRFTDDAYADARVYAGRFYGALQLANASDTKHATLVDGLRYETTTDVFQERSYVTVAGDVRTPPEASQVSRIKSSLQFNYTYAASNTTALQTESGAFSAFLRNSLTWLTQVIPSDTSDEELLDLRVRALNLAHVDTRTGMGAFVPILPYDIYKDQVDGILGYLHEIDRTIDRYQSQLEARKTRELVIDVGKDLNKNIVESGELLHGYINASVEQQKSLSKYYQSLIDQKKAEKKKQASTISSLQSRLNAQRAEMATAVENYKQALKDYKVEEQIHFGIKVASGLFDLGTTIAVPSSSISAVKDLGRLVQGVQKFFNVIAATTKLFDDASGGIGKLQGAQKAFDNVSDVLTSDLNWDELSVQFDAVLSTGPNDPIVNGKKQALTAAFKIFVLRGKAVAAAQASQQKIAREVYDNQRQKSLLDAQVKRLDALDRDMHPANIKDLDVSKIDLIGLTGPLSLIRSQTLGILAEAFTLQDQALQYTYLQPPTPLSSFDTLGIQGALVRQQSAKVKAQTSLGRYQASTTSPIEYTVQIPAHELRDGKAYQFAIHPDAHPFFKYVDLRTISVVAALDGVSGTDSGDYLLTLAYDGQPFFDREIDRDTVTFHTLGRERTYEYEVDGNTPKFSDGGKTWSEGVNPITPFSTWEVSLPTSKTNKGLSFDGMVVTLTLTFVLKARIHDARALRMRRMMDAGAMKRGVQVKHMAEVDVAAAAQPSASDLLSTMAGKTVLNNWDVVFNMSTDKINSVLKKQYEAFKASSKFTEKIDVTTKTPAAPVGDILQYSLQKFALTYGYPRLNFLVNEAQTGMLEMQILSGTVQLGTRYVGDDTDADRKKLVMLAELNDYKASDVKEETIGGQKKLVFQFYAKSKPLGQTATLKALIKLGKVKGLVNEDDDILSVVLDMSKGSFEAKNIEIDMSDAQKLAFSDAVKAYFAENPVQFIVNSLNLKGISTLADLKPSQFLFKTLKTQKTDVEMLQLFIQTNGRSAFNYSQTYLNGVPDPIPQGSECSLMISSKIMFGSVLPQTLTGGWTLAGVDPSKEGAAWSSKFTRASLSGDVDLSSLNSSQGSQAGVTTTSYSPKGGNPVTWDISGLSILCDASGTMKLSYSEKQAFHVVSRSKFCGLFGCTDFKPNYFSTEVTLNIDGNLPSEIEGTGTSQTIKTEMTDQDATIAARTSGGGPCGSTDLQAQVNKQLKDKLPPQLTEHVNASFTGVSVFALQNLLFPSKNYIQLSDAYVPGDLLLLGTFTEIDE